MENVNQSEKEKRIRRITTLYYSQKKVQETLVEFASGREVVPRYFEGFGKRPDTLHYPSDIVNLVQRGATSFHGSEEIWKDPLLIQSDMNLNQINSLRVSWDLLIDIDSPFLDCSKVAAILIVRALEHHGIRNYGIKFSGSKGFHIIVSGKAFPKEFEGMLMNEQFPFWPRAISEYLMQYIRKEYNKEVGKMLSSKEVAARLGINVGELHTTRCLTCGRKAKEGNSILYKCPVCGLTIHRRDVKKSNRRLRCLNGKCAGVLEVLEEKNYWYCEYCKDSENDKIFLSSDKHPSLFEEERGINAEQIANLDLVLVAPRHLFRMPYSLHEKTALASIVLKKSQLENFSPRDADPLKVQILAYLPKNENDEAKRLLAAALSWKKTMMSEQEEQEQQQMEKFQKVYSEVAIDTTQISEEYYPAPIKKLLKGLNDGKKRGLFILITFLRALHYPPEYIQIKVREWNSKNESPLKEGYVKGQLDWHLRQSKKILPPNYDNPSFYKDLGLLDKKPDVKNPIVEVMRELRKRGLVKNQSSEEVTAN